MSHSQRKTPIFGNTTARSEAADKRLWHKRWRTRERDQLAALGPDGDPLPVHYRAVSSTWGIAKDGKQWFELRRQQVLAEQLANRHSPLKSARKTLRARLLAKWRTK